jgi:hypothetical protein
VNDAGGICENVRANHLWMHGGLWGRETFQRGSENMLTTNLKHLETAEEVEEVLKNSANVFKR